MAQSEGRKVDVLRGAAALLEALDLIGDTERGDHDLAKIFCDHEMEIRELVGFASRVVTETI